LQQHIQKCFITRIGIPSPPSAFFLRAATLTAGMRNYAVLGAAGKAGRRTVADALSVLESVLLMRLSPHLLTFKKQLALDFDSNRRAGRGVPTLDQ
jgi:hypothetical protein